MLCLVICPGSFCAEMWVFVCCNFQCCPPRCVSVLITCAYFKFRGVFELTRRFVSPASSFQPLFVMAFVVANPESSLLLDEGDQISVVSVPPSPFPPEFDLTGGMTEADRTDGFFSSAAEEISALHPAGVTPVAASTRGECCSFYWLSVGGLNFCFLSWLFGFDSLEDGGVV